MTPTLLSCLLCLSSAPPAARSSTAENSVPTVDKCLSQAALAKAIPSFVFRGKLNFMSLEGLESGCWAKKSKSQYDAANFAYLTRFPDFYREQIWHLQIQSSSPEVVLVGHGERLVWGGACDDDIEYVSLFGSAKDTLMIPYHGGLTYITFTPDQQPAVFEHLPMKDSGYQGSGPGCAMCVLHGSKTKSGTLELLDICRADRDGEDCDRQEDSPSAAAKVAGRLYRVDTKYRWSSDVKRFVPMTRRCFDSKNVLKATASSLTGECERIGWQTDWTEVPACERNQADCSTE